MAHREQPRQRGRSEQTDTYCLNALVLEAEVENMSCDQSHNRLPHPNRHLCFFLIFKGEKTPLANQLTLKVK